MIIQVHMKTSDTLDRVMDDLPYPDDEDVAADMEYDIRNFLKRFIKFGESVTLEFDTEAGTAKVLETR